MTDVAKHTEDWQRIPWKAFQRNVYRLQKRIYQAERRGNRKQVHNLQRLLMRSWSARCLAVRQVTQDNRGKRTAGVDGVAALRLAKLPKRAAPVRRVYIPKPSSPDERRPLGIPTMYDRAAQALVKLALEPQWEARFEANSYGFPPGRGAHDAIEAIFKAIERKPKYVLDADIEKCFVRINHQQLLAKLHAIQPITRLVRAWLKAGIVDGDEMLFPEAGTPQGGVVSPLLANVALHGLESHLIKACPSMVKPCIIRYADDFVIQHEDLEVLRALREQAETWLAGMGLRLKASKTHICHTLQATDGAVGFTVRQYLVGKYRTNTFRGQPGYKTFIKPSRKAQNRHVAALRKTVRNHQGQAQAALIGHLNPLIRMACRAISTSCRSHRRGEKHTGIQQRCAGYCSTRVPLDRCMPIGRVR
jgi:RNA-directed DNA polymerase